MLSLSLAVSASAQEPHAVGQSAGRNMAEMKFVTVPGLPTCSPGSVQSGDPTKGPSIILAKVAAGCSIPWHWHTPNEHLMIVSGVARVEMKDGKPLTLRAGGFAMMPSRHVHQFRCDRSCVLYIYSDVAFDIHYVDGKGKEISPGEALKAVKETAATEIK
jgi:quercetin dioxygenase-like cupin family protein